MLCRIVVSETLRFAFLLVLVGLGNVSPMRAKAAGEGPAAVAAAVAAAAAANGTVTDRIADLRRQRAERKAEMKAVRKELKKAHPPLL